MRSMPDFRSMSFSVIGIMAALLFFCFPSDVTQAAAQDAGESTTDLENGQAIEDRTADDILHEAQQRGSVKIIVKLGTAFRGEGELSSAQDVLSQRYAIAQGQDQLLAALAAHRISNVKRFKYVPYMAMTVDDAGLGELINHPAVVQHL